MVKSLMIAAGSEEGREAGEAAAVHQVERGEGYGSCENLGKNDKT